MAMSGDDSELVRFLSAHFATGAVALVRLESDCVSRVYRGTIGGQTLFVKWGENDSACATAFLRTATTDLVARPLEGFPVCLGPGWVNVYPWRETTRVAPERMTDRQFESFLTRYDELFAALQTTPREAVAPTLDAKALREKVRAYVARHPLARGLLKSLVSLRDEEIDFPASTPLVIIHGDFHCGNFGFTGENLSFFCDFDLLRIGAQVEDLVFLFADRLKRRAGGRQGRAVLVRRLRHLFGRLDRPVHEWRIAVNRLRLYAAVRLIDRHPERLRAAWTVRRRDRRLTDLCGWLGV